MQTSNSQPENQSQRGQALVEFALVLMFIILPFIYVLIQGAITLYTLANVTNAAREAAHAGSIFICDTGTCNLTYNQTLAQQVSVIDQARKFAITTTLTSDTFARLRNLVAVNQCDITVGYTTLNPVNSDMCPTGSTTPCPNPGNPYRELDSMKVNVACPQSFLFGLAGTNMITLSATSTMRIEPGGMEPAP